SMSAIRGDQVRPLAVTTKERNAQLPDVPSIMDTLPSFPEMRSWVGVFAPKNTPEEITKLLATAVLKATASPEFLQALTPNGFERLPLEGEKMKDFIKSELPKWKDLIEEAGISQQ
ncbi:MAG: Bug family tripartite tricarboxylate transporter substrate binding protein, partial [Burkholderiaceae bacterium]